MIFFFGWQGARKLNFDHPCAGLVLKPNNKYLISDLHGSEISHLIYSREKRIKIIYPFWLGCIATFIQLLNIFSFFLMILKK